MPHDTVYLPDQFGGKNLRRSEGGDEIIGPPCVECLYLSGYPYTWLVASMYSVVVCIMFDPATFLLKTSKVTGVVGFVLYLRPGRCQQKLSVKNPSCREYVK